MSTRQRRITGPVSDYSAAVDPRATGPLTGRESGDLEEDA